MIILQNTGKISKRKAANKIISLPQTIIIHEPEIANSG